MYLLLTSEAIINVCNRSLHMPQISRTGLEHWSVTAGFQKAWMLARALLITD